MDLFIITAYRVGIRMEVNIRKAVLDDVDELYELIDGYAQKGIMLPRSKRVIGDKINTFTVAVVGNQVVGCGSLFQLGTDLVEIRSLGVLDSYKGKGIGKLLVHFLVDEAKLQKLPKIMALTYEVSFFIKNGFEVVPKEIFPEKVWTDCIHCKKQDSCDEIAVLKRL